MKYLPVTVIITLTSSLFVAMVISPTVCSMLSDAGARRKPREHGLIQCYKGLLRAALRHWPATLLLAVLLLVGLGVTYAKRGSGVELFPEFDPRRAIINIRCPQGTNVRETDRIARIVERRLEPFRPDIQHVVTNVGSAGGFTLTGASTGPHVGNVTVLFHDYEDRKRKSADAVKEIRQVLADIPGAEIKVEKEKEGPPTGAAVTVRIIGREFKTLERLAEKAKGLIADVPGLVNLRSDLEVTRPELSFRVDRRRAALLGLNPTIIGNFLKTAVFGREVGTYRQFNDEYDITIRLPRSQREKIQDLFRLHVPSNTGHAVPLSSLGTFDYRPGFGTIHRINQTRVVTLTADAEGRLGPAVLADAQARLDPLGYASLLSSDIKDLPAFCRKLADARAAPVRRVRELLEPGLLGGLTGDVRRTIREVADAGKADKKAQKSIVAALKGLLGRRDLYRQEDFAGTELDKQARELLQRERNDLRANEVRRLNRLLLEAAFPTLLTRRERLQVPPGYLVRYAGEQEEQEKARQFLFGRALPLALLLIVLILVTQFNTLSAPLIIMFTVILSTIGVFAGLLLCRMPFGIIMTGVGLISLAGVVVNNAIVLLDYTRQLQRRGMEVMSAAVQAGVTRLRPVLLTATTTILGLIPMATGISLNIHKFDPTRLSSLISTRSESSQFWASMAIAVIFGLAFATLLTLVVVPTLYTTLYRAAARFGLGGLKKTGEVEPPPLPATAE